MKAMQWRKKEGEGRKAGDDGDDDTDGMMGRLEWVIQIWCGICNIQMGMFYFRK